MPPIYTPVAVCPGCESDVLNDDQGRVVDPEGRVWHPECRKVEKRRAAGRRQRQQKPAEVTA